MAGDFESRHLERIGKKLYLNSESADVFFLFHLSENEIVRVPAHKAFLEGGSEVFKTMFHSGLEEGDVVIKDVSVGGFEDFLQFFYLGCVQLKVENLADVMILADKYDVAECMQICEVFIQQNLTNSDFLVALEVAILLDRKELKEFIEYKIGKQAAPIFASDQFKYCSYETLANLLSIKNLECGPQEILDACVDWAIQSCKNNGVDDSLVENRRYQLGDCFHLIPFDVMDPCEIAESVIKYRGLFNSAELEDVIEMQLNRSSTLQKFKRKTLFIEWNERAVLACPRVGHWPMMRNYINQFEIVTFQVNQRIYIW